MPEGYTDGIFYGFAKEIGWDKYIIDDPVRPVLYEIPQTTVSQIAEKMLATFHLTGFKVIGNQNANVKKVWIPGHILEGNPRSDEMISYIQNNNINLILPLELIDFTVAEYVRDSALLGENRAIISMGHFNLEEPGMRYMCTYLKEAIDQDIPCTFIQAGDMYRYITR
jgi:NIF3 (NGG1p interacting factor 3).